MNAALSKKERSVILAVLLSVLLHGFATAALFFSLFQVTPVSTPFHGLQLTWVSLETNAGGRTSSPVNMRISNASISQRMEKPLQAALERIPDNHAAELQQTAHPAGNGGETPANNPSVAGGQTGFSSFANHESGGSTGVPGKIETIAYPLYKENAPPSYPAWARLQGYEGEVLLGVEILPNGRVGSIKIKKSSGYAILDQSALEAVRPWKFEPARKSGMPLKVWVDLPIKFILNHKNSKS